MEATATESATASLTIADLIPSAAARHGERVAVRYKRDGDWHDVSYTQLAEIVNEVGLGLLDLGIQPGERVCILANTRPDWSYADMGATSHRGDRGADLPDQLPRGVPVGDLRLRTPARSSCEDEEQLAKIVEIRDRIPNIRSVHHLRPARRSEHQRVRRQALPLDAITLEAAARARPRPPRSRSSKPAAPASAPTTPSPSSTPPAPPARRRAACSPTATTGR